MKDHILKEIERSSAMLDLEEGWDDEDAKVIDKEFYTKALEFFTNLMNDVDEDSEGLEINPCKDGSIDFSFREENFRLLINIGEKRTCWYGDNRHDGDQIRSNQNDMPANAELVLWLKEKLKKS